MATVTKPMNLDETQQQIVTKLDAIKEAILQGGGGGGSAQVAIFNTLAEVEQAIASGTLKNGDCYTIKSDYEDFVGATDISTVGDGTLTGAISQLSETIEAYNISDTTDITSYTSTNQFTVPKDGYIHLYCSTNSSIMCRIGVDGMSDYLRERAMATSTLTDGRNIFVKKGMKVYFNQIVGSVNAYYVPFN